MFFQSKSAKASADFISKLKAAPVVQEALHEIELTELAKRQALIDELDALGATVRTFSNMRTRREAEINAEILAVDQRRTELGAELNELDAAGSRIRSTTGRELSELIAQIKAGADPRINNFVVWAQRAYSMAIEHTWQASSNSKFFAIEGGSEARVALANKLLLESVARLGALVTSSLERADAMRMEASLPDDVELELQSMAAPIYAEYVSQSRSQSLPKDFLARLAGVTVVEVSEINEPVQG